MKKVKVITVASLLAFMLIVVQACKKSSTAGVIVPPEQAHFVGQTSGVLFVTSPGATFKIPVGLTAVSDKDRTVNINITSRTGAQAGSQYNIVSKAIVIPAGRVIDSIVITGVQSQYQSGRKDTLDIQIVDGDVSPAAFNNTYTLVLRGGCSQSDIATDLQSLKGDYTNTVEQWGSGSPYGPYKTSIKSITLTSATTANIVVANLFDDNPQWNDLTFTLDWTDINNRKIIVNPSPQNAGSNAGNAFGATYDGQPYAVRAVSASAGSLVGTFDFCAQKLTLKMQIGVWNVGFSSSIYTVNMAR